MASIQLLPHSKQYIFQWCPLDTILINRATEINPHERTYIFTSFHTKDFTSGTQTKGGQLALLLKKMLNSRALSALLSKNVCVTLSPRWIVMTPNATLLAYSEPNVIREIRDQATLISMAWREQSGAHSYQSTEAIADTVMYDREDNPIDPKSVVRDGMLESLTIEFAGGNVLVRALQPHLLLVLIGGTLPTGAKRQFRITPEVKGQPSYPARDWRPSAVMSRSPDFNTISDINLTHEHLESALIANGNGNVEGDRLDDEEQAKEVQTAILSMQRIKIDLAADYLKLDFNREKFLMPADMNGP